MVGLPGQPLRIGRQRHGTAATHGAGDGALGRHTQPGRHVYQRSQRSSKVWTTCADFDTECTLSRSRQRLVGLEHGADAIAQPEPFEASRSQHDGVVLPFVQLAQTGVQIAAQRLDAHVLPSQTIQGLPKQDQAAQTGSAHHRIGWQPGRIRRMGRHPGVAGVLALHHASQLKAGRQVHRHVLQGVNSDICAPLLEGHLQLLDKQALPAHLGQAAVENLVSLRGHAQQADPVTSPLQQGLDVLGLPERQPALAGGDGDGQRCGGC